MLEIYQSYFLFISLLLLGSPLLGDIQVSLFDRRGVLQVEIIRAKGLVVKPGAKTLPGTLFHITLFSF